jgi:NitT/TauT family transport system substrate-binding protein
MSKRSVCNALCLLTFFFGVLAAGCHGSPGEKGSENGLTKVTLQADWYPQPEHGGFYTALVKGYYQQEGLDVSIQPGSQYSVPDQLVASGVAEFGLGSSDRTLESVADGQPLVAVAATMQSDPQGIMWTVTPSPSSRGPPGISFCKNAIIGRTCARFPRP